MRRISRLALLSTTLFAAPAFAQSHTYEIDKSHTNIQFYVNHLGFSDMIGNFTSYDGSLAFDEKNPEKSTIDFTLKPASIRTSSSELDKHLQGEKFFNSTKFPDIHFVSKSIKLTGKNTGDVTGDLSMLGVTKPAVLHVTFNKADYHPMTKMYVAGFSGTATIKRSDFGMDYIVPMVSDEVRLTVQMEAVDNTRKQAEAITHN